MATNHKFPGKQRPGFKPAPVSVKALLEAEEAAAAPVSIESFAAEPVSVEAVAVSVTAELAPPRTRSATSSAELDPSAWPLKTLDLMNENAVAILDFAAALGKATSLSDAIEAQSRFASERYSALLRQATEMSELTRRFTFDASAPVRLSFSAFLA